MNNIKTNFLGDFPEHIPDSEILDYFIYAFEYVWITPTYEHKRKTIRDYFKGKLENIELLHPLNLKQRWWALALLSIRDIAIAEELIFLKETLDAVLKKIHTLSESELKSYTNLFNQALYEETECVISLRLIEMPILNSDAGDEDIDIKFYLAKKNEMVNLFKKHLLQKDIDFINFNKDIDRKSTLKYSDFWSMYYEFFIGYISSTFDLHQLDKKLIDIIDDKKIDLLRQINLPFFTTSIKSKNKIDDLNRGMALILMPLVKEFLIN